MDTFQDRISKVSITVRELRTMRLQEAAKRVDEVLEAMSKLNERMCKPCEVVFKPHDLKLKEPYKFWDREYLPK